MPWHRVFRRDSGPQYRAGHTRAYADAGGRFIDTAESYQGGESEKVVGDFVAGDRDDYIIATKYGVGIRRSEGFSRRGNGRKAMITAVEGSLRRLRTDYIDLYWTHGNDPDVPVDEVMAALDNLVRSGKVLHIGLGNYPAWRNARAATVAELRNSAPLTAVTFEYGVAERDAERELLPCAEALGLGVAAWSPLGGGFLARNDPNPTSHLVHWTDRGRPGTRDMSVHRAVHNVAREAGVAPAVIGYAWVLDRARRSSTTIAPIIGASSPLQVTVSLDALQLTLTERQIDTLDGASGFDLGEPHNHNDHSAHLMTAGTSHRSQTLAV